MRPRVTTVGGPRNSIKDMAGRINSQRTAYLIISETTTGDVSQKPDKDDLARIKQEMHKYTDKTI